MTDNTPTDEAQELAHEHAVRALDQQADVLDNVRARTTVMIAAMSLVATFLGGQTLSAQSPHQWLDYAAALPLVALAIGIFFTVRVLQPTPKDADTAKAPEDREGLQLTINAAALLDAPEARQRGVKEFVARSAQEQWEGNDTIIDKKLDYFTWATWALLAQVVMWVALLVGKGVN